MKNRRTVVDASARTFTLASNSSLHKWLRVAAIEKAEARLLLQRNLHAVLKKGKVREPRRNLFYS
jgi:hypothetical protein